MRRRDVFFAAKLIVITGGTSGIGFALAEALSRHKARIVILADQPASTAAAVTQLGGDDHQVYGYVCDIGSPESVAEACGRVLASHGAPDILINNAGFAIYRTFEQEDHLQIERLMSVNFAGAIRVTKAFLNGMVQRRSGHIVNIASIAAVLPLTPSALYTAAKHGLLGWSECIAAELKRFDIDVTVICPGRVKTNFFNHETFQNRLHRKEAELTIPLEVVVDAILDAILRRQFMRYVPKYYGFLAWAYHALGPLARPLLRKLVQSRIEDIYRNPNRP